ncbi:MAG: hypothetical protein K0R15_1325 [Clostridiales bacterium]|jgi:hypothetical protein|nr:hypothetical protein [Clostridiales bacterium]
MEGLLPVGSVVLLKDSTKKVVIIGFCQREIGDGGKIWDYSGCLYPEGYFGADKCFLFNADQIDKLYFIGFQDEEQLKFKVRAEQLLADKRAEENQM